MSPATPLTGGATYRVVRWEGAGEGNNSDTYGFLSSLSHAVTPRLTGLLGYGFTYLNIQRQGTSTTHTPTLGLSYQLTQTLTGTVAGGPAITESDGDTTGSPAGSASLV